MARTARKHSFSDAAWDEVSAYAAGLILADGCWARPKRSNRSPFLRLELHAKDREVVDIIGEYFDRPVHLNKTRNHVAVSLYGPQNWKTEVLDLSSDLQPHYYRGLLMEMVTGPGMLQSFITVNRNRMLELPCRSYGPSWI